jgi:hypothetical protein
MSETRSQGPEHLQPHQVQGFALDDFLISEHLDFCPHCGSVQLLLRF